MPLIGDALGKESYALKDKKTGKVLKYSETTQGNKRYTKKYLNDKNADMDFQAKGSKKEMHDWQHEKILDYKTITMVQDRH